MNLEFRERLQIASRDCRCNTVCQGTASDHLVGTRAEGRNGAPQYLRLTNQKGIQQKRISACGGDLKGKPGIYVLKVR